MNIRRILTSKFSKIIISFLLGFGLASIFRINCTGKNCHVYHAPESLSKSNTVYKYNNKMF